MRYSPGPRRGRFLLQTRPCIPQHGRVIQVGFFTHGGQADAAVLFLYGQTQLAQRVDRKEHGTDRAAAFSEPDAQFIRAAAGAAVLRTRPCGTFPQFVLV